MRNEIVAEIGGCPVLVMDSISLIAPRNTGTVVISGSHGGAISGAFAAKHPPVLVFFNDAGIGKNDAGVASLAMLERDGIPAAAVSHVTARIGDALDAWLNGVVSRINGPAAGKITIGQPVRDAVESFISAKLLEKAGA
ncbi:hypothetical protein [Microvirga massiliensis]|uniref:hypothetical protein n=1 Tax=Microvirga massiliensis TaxID=1033741 RepID=UPI00062B3D02|nr:hypothetical protein [Microvirga massiliensis]